MINNGYSIELITNVAQYLNRGEYLEGEDYNESIYLKQRSYYDYSHHSTRRTIPH